MSRLTNDDKINPTLKATGYTKCATTCKHMTFCDICPIQEAIKKLAHYEDLEEQGRLIELPCAVGEPIFEANRGEIVQHSLQKNWKIVRYLDEGVFGEIAFTTKEEAEAKLAELKGVDKNE